MAGEPIGYIIDHLTDGCMDVDQISITKESYMMHPIRKEPIYLPIGRIVHDGLFLQELVKDYPRINIPHTSGFKIWYTDIDDIEIFNRIHIKDPVTSLPTMFSRYTDRGVLVERMDGSSMEISKEYWLENGGKEYESITKGHMSINDVNIEVTDTSTKKTEIKPYIDAMYRHGMRYIKKRCRVMESLLELRSNALKRSSPHITNIEASDKSLIPIPDTVRAKLVMSLVDPPRIISIPTVPPEIVGRVLDIIGKGEEEDMLLFDYIKDMREVVSKIEYIELDKALSEVDKLRSILGYRT